MHNKFLGFALIGLVGFAACHNIFNKDKSRKRTATAIAVKSDIQSQQAAADGINPAPDSAARASLKYVYLTFDDGPDAGTMNCYSTCKSRGVKATFFLVGEHAHQQKGKMILDTMRQDLRHFLFANHSYTHAAHNRYESFYGNAETAFLDFQRLDDSMQLPAPIVRFPGNNVWVVNNKARSTRLTKRLSRLMDSAGYDVLGWDVEWHFDRQSRPVQSAEEMAAEVVRAVEAKTSMVENHVVLLAHDRMFREANYKDSLAKMITILQSQKGYIFETADQYPALRKNDRRLMAARK